MRAWRRTFERERRREERDERTRTGSGRDDRGERREGGDRREERRKGGKRETEALGQDRFRGRTMKLEKKWEVAEFAVEMSYEQNWESA